MKVFSIFGITDSGKTSTVEALIKEFRQRGYSVGTVKDIHFEAFAIDREGTDTHRHKEAGADLVTARGLYETDILFPKRLALEEVLKFYQQDFVILEGSNDFQGPGIISAHTTDEVDERLRENIFAIVGQISGKIREYKGLPVIDGRLETKRLADLILEKVDPWKEK